MDKEKLNDIICQSSSDYEILNDAYDYIENLEKQCEKQKEVIYTIKNILNNQMNYREYVDIVNAIEEVIKEVE